MTQEGGHGISSQDAFFKMMVHTPDFFKDMILKFALKGEIEPLDLTLTIQNKTYKADFNTPLFISIRQEFSPCQPNFFGGSTASKSPLILGDFVADTSKGASCNVDELMLIPHCNGTHTESISHIVNELIPPTKVITAPFFPLCLITVTPICSIKTTDRYRPRPEPQDKIITRKMIDRAIAPFMDLSLAGITALAIRTLPNDESKKNSIYEAKNPPPFLSIDAIERVNELGILHLLVDIPSIDRMHDEGLLTNHHLFWNLTETSHTLTEIARCDKTITEMIYADNDIADGWYLLNLQLPDLLTDAIPSRPVLYPLHVT